MLDIADYLKDVQLPTMPEVARLLINSMQDDEIPLEKIRNAISKDPSLTAKLIRLANSAPFGLARNVGSVDDAISMVGLNQVRTLCLAACMSDSFPMSTGINRDEFWKESMACAGYAHWIARTIGADAQQAWLTGFMLRLGELIIAQKEPEKLVSIEKMPHLPGGRWDREMDQTGFTEGHIVGELARQWNFPPRSGAGFAAQRLPHGHQAILPIGGNHSRCHALGRVCVGIVQYGARNGTGPARRRAQNFAAGPGVDGKKSSRCQHLYRCRWLACSGTILTAGFPNNSGQMGR